MTIRIRARKTLCYLHFCFAVNFQQEVVVLGLHLPRHFGDFFLVQFVPLPVLTLVLKLRWSCSLSNGRSSCFSVTFSQIWLAWRRKSSSRPPSSQASNSGDRCLALADDFATEASLTGDGYVSSVKQNKTVDTEIGSSGSS